MLAGFQTIPAKFGNSNDLTEQSSLQCQGWILVACVCIRLAVRDKIIYLGERNQWTVSCLIVFESPDINHQTLKNQFDLQVSLL